MRRNDSLVAIRLMRRLEAEQARRQFGNARQNYAEAERRQADVTLEMNTQIEQSSAADFSAWLPAAILAQEQALDIRQRAVAVLAVAQGALAATIRTERILKEEALRRLKAIRAERLARAQIEVDNLVKRIIELDSFL